jgi:uncharacterized protein YerC
MAQVSKYPITKEVYETIFEVFSKTIAGLSTKKQVSDFFDEFLSPTERIMLAKRLAIGLLLAKEYNYDEISKILRVSSPTIAGMALTYKYKNSYRKLIDDILTDEKFEDFWLKVGENITAILSVSGAKGGKGWRYLKEEIKGRRLKKAF